MPGTISDILFTAADGATKLNHEIESYNPATGQLIAWVHVPTVSPTSDTVLYIYYGNASATSQQNPTGVWDSNYQAVYHLPNGTTLSGSDSTANGNNASTVTATATSGEIDGAANFNGSQRITLPNIALSNSMTLEAWIYPTTFNAAGRIVCKNYTSASAPWINYCLSFNSANHLEVSVSIGGNFVYLDSSSGLNTNTWYHVLGVYDGSGLNIYINGVLDAGPLSASGNIDRLSQVTEIGYNTVIANQTFTGTIDEVRISSIARSAGWIGTEYNNQGSPSTFLSFGSQQGSWEPPPVATPTFSPGRGSYTSAQTVTISTTTSGASIRYTTDGSTLSETAGTLYTGPVAVNASLTLNAIAYESGFTDSTVASASYTITGTNWYSPYWSDRNSIWSHGDQ